MVLRNSIILHMQAMNNVNKPNKLDSLVLLRGIAVIMVCLCHFGGALARPHQFSFYSLFHEFGKYGVEIFFVISGFVIPLSLYKGRYKIGDYFRFLYKRFLRLQLPYVAGLVFTLLLMYFSYRLRSLPFPESPVSILKSIFYLHVPADNPVFWTLVVEVQYYFFIGLLFPFLIKFTKAASLIILFLAILTFCILLFNQTC